MVLNSISLTIGSKTLANAQLKHFDILYLKLIKIYEYASLVDEYALIRI